MEKSTAYLIALVIVVLAVLGVAGEYFAYKYYALTAEQKSQQQAPQGASATTAAPNSNPAQPMTNSSEDSIVSFDFASPAAVGAIDQTHDTISITVPLYTDITKLTPAIEVSKYATVSPASGISQDFTNPVAYLVTAQDGSTKEYVATVNIASASAETNKAITSFILSGFNPEIDGTIDNADHSIYVVVPDGTDLTDLTPIIEVSDGATISPGNTSQDFTYPVIYTVTAQDGSTQNYTVTVVTESNSG